LPVDEPWYGHADRRNLRRRIAQCGNHLCHLLNHAVAVKWSLATLDHAPVLAYDCRAHCSAREIDADKV
jgi:hypothetical protein